MAFWTVSVQKSAKTLITKESFLEVVSPDALGCLWVTNQPINAREKPFSWFDYILDGTLESHVQSSPAAQKSFFAANQYDRSFYVLQVESGFPNLDKAFQEAFSLFKPQENLKKVICLSPNPKVFAVNSIKNNKQFEFEYFIY